MVWRVGGPIGSSSAPVRIDAWQWSWHRNRHTSAKRAQSDNGFKPQVPETKPQASAAEHKRAKVSKTSSQPWPTASPPEDAAPAVPTEGSSATDAAVWVMASTHQCAQGGCIPCRAKVLQGTGAASVPNARPESCPRFVAENAPRPSRTIARSIGLYSPSQRILTVGDGDLTFTLALARALGGDRLIASSYEVRSSSSPTAHSHPSF